MTDNSKNIYFLRHGQSFLNAWVKADHNDEIKRNGFDSVLWDAKLTDKGKRQAQMASQLSIPQLPPLDLVLVSPHSRAIQTFHYAFEERLKMDPPLQVLVCPECCEHLTQPDDIGRTPKELEMEFPLLSFSHLKNVWWWSEFMDEEDWKPSRLRFLEQPFEEPRPHFEERAERFKKLVASRSEKNIAVVSHYDVIFQLIFHPMGNCELVHTSFDPENLKFSVLHSYGRLPVDI